MTVQHPFIGRKKELKRLHELAMKKSASLVVIRGRRRIGKSRLAQEFAKKTTHYIFSGLAPVSGITAQGQREEFAIQLQRELKIPLPRADDWSDLFWHLVQQTQKGKVVIILDEISWMGSKDRLFLSKLKIAWDLHFKNNPQLILILCGSISSWIERNILSSTAFLGRISLDITLEELPLHECNEFWSGENRKISPYEKFKILSITGGVPRYLEEILPQKNAEENITNLCFRKEGFLFNEFERIFSDLFSKRSATYKKIVKRLADGPCEQKDIYAALKVQKSGVVSKYLEDLVLSGFISQDFSWNIKDGSESKLCHYRLKDNYLRFYLKYIEPNKRKIEKQRMKLPAQWQTILGFQFENLVLNNCRAIQRILGIEPSDIIDDNPYFQRKSKDRPGCQIDYLIQSRFGTCYVCEIKFSSKELTKEVIREVQAKMDSLALPKQISLRPVLIHVNGISKEIKESGFFAALIDFDELLLSP